MTKNIFNIPDSVNDHKLSLDKINDGHVNLHEFKTQELISYIKRWLANPKLIVIISKFLETIKLRRQIDRYRRDFYFGINYLFRTELQYLDIINNLSNRKNIWFFARMLNIPINNEVYLDIE
ncbi:hypothetical protein RF11_02993 [Thelohanellus kitauei]|uniref:Uncharacterized protein n=1 Tax=Thelohanellus kitauei TaxID=669202 RepID=A0A0C2N711_THEKT|nr:hypothetical protein RF11_02993 [Thelohanellus kitauei]